MAQPSPGSPRTRRTLGSQPTQKTNPPPQKNPGTLNGCHTHDALIKLVMPLQGIAMNHNRTPAGMETHDSQGGAWAALRPTLTLGCECVTPLA